MTKQEIKCLTADEVYRKVAESLWPWDENKCRVCGWMLFSDTPPNALSYRRGNCTPSKCCMYRPPKERADTPPNLQSWDGVGRMAEAMGERGQWFMIGTKWNGKFQVEFAGNAFNQAEGPTPWEATARAVLLALAN